MTSATEEDPIIDSKTLNEFLAICFFKKEGEQPIVLEKLSDPVVLWSLLDEIDPSSVDDLKPSNSENEGCADIPNESLIKLIEHMDKVLSYNYSDLLKPYIDRIRAVPLNDQMAEPDLRRLGEFLVVLCIESPQANNFVSKIMSLSDESQLSIQSTIERFTFLESRILSASNRSDLSLASSMGSDPSNLSLLKSESRMASNTSSTAKSKQVVPPLSLNRIGKEDSPNVGQNDTSLGFDPGSGDGTPLPLGQKIHAGRLESKTLSTRRSSNLKEFMKFRSRNNSQMSSPIGHTTSNATAESSIWNRKYDKLKSEYRQVESQKEEFLSKIETLQKEMHLLTLRNQKLEEEFKLHTNESHSSLLDTVEGLETELLEWRKNVDELTKEKNLLEKKHQAEITGLKDEIHLLNKDAERVTKLETAIQKFKVRAEEAAIYKKRNAELEEKVQDYMGRLLEVESANRNVLDLKRSIDIYKEKCATLEASVTTLTAHNNSLQSQLTDTSEKLLEAERLRSISEQRHAKTVAEYEAQILEAQQGSDLNSAGNNLGIGFVTDLNTREKLARLEKENLDLKQRKSAGSLNGDYEQSGTVELENQLDDVRRLKDKYEQQYQAALTKISELEQVKGVSVRTGDQSESEEVNKLRWQLVEKEKEEIKAKAAIESLELQNETLQNRIAQDKVYVNLAEANIRSNLENQYESIVSTLKEQLQLRERELVFFKLSREEQSLIHRREERLMASAFHELGHRYFQLKSEKEKIEIESQAVMLRIKDGG